MQITGKRRHNLPRSRSLKIDHGKLCLRLSQKITIRPHQDKFDGMSEPNKLPRQIKTDPLRPTTTEVGEEEGDGHKTPRVPATTDFRLVPMDSARIGPKIFSIAR
ncbi:hypothetical protein SAMN05444389_101245 [Paracoccus solventivorans]|uniref:Uncharacterized protein n=1 Tax=Paracoccus solventivorans TaxID=53463 RepID=A0A1M7DAX6_9RHOB|nr:hypothetical protein SAMN05444389_101245 [Paracoccus solventivorans]